jgi:hypothetical protein
MAGPHSPSSSSSSSSSISCYVLGIERGVSRRILACFTTRTPHLRYRIGVGWLIPIENLHRYADASEFTHPDARENSFPMLLPRTFRIESDSFNVFGENQPGAGKQGWCQYYYDHNNSNENMKGENPVCTSGALASFGHFFFPRARRIAVFERAI